MRLLFWTRAARNDVENLTEYMRPIDQQAVEQIVAKFGGAAEFLRETPFAGEQLDQRASRRWPVRGTPYILVYRPFSDRVEILRVHHHAENWRRK